jgi:hypothetical protein
MPISTRTLSGEDLIQLPRFGATGAVAVGELLLAAAAPVGELPRPIAQARDGLEQNLATLRAAVAARMARSVAHPAVVVDADTVLDLCWTALHDWLAGFARLPATEPARETLEARALLADLCPDGLSFLLLPYELEWDQSDQRLTRILSGPLGDRIAALGGRVFIDALKAAHASYGELLGLPRPAGQGDPNSLREALDGFVSALRIYAVKVTAHVDLEQPQTAALAKTLLDPLMMWQSAKMGGFEGETTLH